VSQGERESITDVDPETLLFGLDDELDSDADPFGAPLRPSPVSRSARRQQERARERGQARRGRIGLAVAAVVVVVLAVVFVPKVIDHFKTADYSGSGFGTAQVVIPSGASADDIGNILVKDGVVKSSKAFTDAASNDSDATSIQSGTYRLKQHMSGASALAALLRPSSRVAGADVAIPEGYTVMDVEARLVQHFGAASKAKFDADLKGAANLGVPTSYETDGKFPTSLEGFLYPATYSFDPGTTPQSALQQMVSRFIEQDRSTSFAIAAKKAGETPYEALIIASIAQAEAKFPADMPKVARVILNRLHNGTDLQIDAISAYGAKLQGLDPAKVVFRDVTGPYNTYTHAGLPPTPIDNPGAAAMNAAVHPAAGNWTYYVNGDKDGHLYFTNSASQFAKAAATCRRNNWGCG